MKVLEELNNILSTIENAMQIELKDDDFVVGRDQLLHIFLHEASHAVVTNQVKWIHELDEDKETAVDEILARFLDDDFVKILGMASHTIAEHVNELSKYPVQISENEFSKLKDIWRKVYFPERNVEGMAKELLLFFNDK